MKRKLSIILCCLIMIGMIMPFQNKRVLAAENKINEFKSEVEGITSNFVKFFIEDKNHELTTGLERFSVMDIEIPNIGMTQFNDSKSIERTEEGWIISIENLNWEVVEKVYVSVPTSKYLLAKEITKADVGSTIELKPDENFVPLQISMPFAGENFNIERVRVNYIINEGGKTYSSYGGLVNVGTLIPQGNCSMQVIAYDESNAYNVVKKNWKITKDNNTISFNRDEVANVKMNFDSLQPINGKIVSISPRNDGYLGQFQSSNPKRGDKTYDSYFVNKESCHFINYSLDISNSYYMFQTEYFDLNDDLKVINVGVNLEANINLKMPIYVQGERLKTDEFEIIDEYHNKLNVIFQSNSDDSPFAWELKDEEGIVTSVELENGSAFISSIKLPSVVGTFDISIKNLNSPLNISCDPVKITIALAVEPLVKFADANLERVIREAIKKPEGEISKSDLEEIFVLNANERNISSLEGIENLTNLNSLSLAKNSIVDITPVCFLSNLSYLNLYHNKVKDIGGLVFTNNLEKLVLDVNQIEDISVLSNKIKLKELSVCANPVKDLEVLRTLPNLTSFHFGENQNVDISILECLPNLTDLRWAYTRSTENINVLKNLTKLQKAILCGNKIKDITPLAKLTNLSELYIDQNEISDIAALVDNCTNGGFATGYRAINISNNNLDISQGSNTHKNILTLIVKGINITFEPQKPEIPKPISEVVVELLTKVVDFKVGEDAKIEYKVTNNMTEDKEVTLIIGVYNLDNRLIGYVKTSKIVKTGETVNIDSAIIGLPAGAYKVRAFVWDNLSEMNPYINITEIPVN